MKIKFNEICKLKVLPLKIWFKKIQAQKIKQIIKILILIIENLNFENKCSDSYDLYYYFDGIILNINYLENLKIIGW